MADRTLVQGAALLGKSMQGPDIAGAIEKGLESGLAPAKEYLKKKEAKERDYELGKAKKLGSFAEGYIPNALEGKNKIFVDKSLRESRMEYSNMLDQIKDLPKSSEEYLNGLSKLTEIKAGFAQTNKDSLEFSELGAEYIKESQKRNISSGMPKEDRIILDKIFIDKNYEIVRDAVSGKLSYKVDGQIIPQEKLDDWKIPNTEYPLRFTEKYSKKAEKEGFTSGEKLNPESSTYKEIEFGIASDLKNMPIEEIRSLFLDKTIEGEAPLVISSPGEDVFSLTKEELISKAHSGLMKTIMDVNQIGASKYKGSASRSSESDKRMARNFNNIKSGLKALKDGSIKQFIIPGTKDTISKNEDGTYNYNQRTSMGLVAQEGSKNLKMQDVIFLMPNVSQEKLMKELIDSSLNPN